MTQQQDSHQQIDSESSAETDTLPEQQSDDLDAIDLKNCGRKIILLSDRYDHDFVDSLIEKEVFYLHIREDFYLNYLPKKIVIPRYPQKADDGFVRQIIHAIVDYLPPSYPFNYRRIAVSIYSGALLKESGDFFSLVERILKDLIKDFFTHSIQLPNSGICIVDGVHYDFEASFLKQKFGKSVVAVGCPDDKSNWFDTNFNGDAKAFVEEFCA